jgi:hypothetical protein
MKLLRTWIAQSWCRLIFNEIARHREAVAGEPTDAAEAGASARAGSYFKTWPPRWWWH